MGPSAKRRKTAHHGVEEVKFDVAARQEFLTGFRKRKQARIQHAQKVAAEKERLAKIEERKQVSCLSQRPSRTSLSLLTGTNMQLRQQRQQDLEDHVKAVNEAVKKAEAGNFDSDEEAEDATEPMNQIQAASEGDTGSDAQEEPESDSAREDQYIDEEKFTTVTVQPMDEYSESSEDGLDSDEGNRTEDRRTASENIRGKSKSVAKRSSVREESNRKKKRKNFRYESKADRKLGKLQQKAKKRRAAARRIGNTK